MPERVAELRKRLYSGHEGEIMEWLDLHGSEIFEMMSGFEGYGIISFLSGRGYNVSHLEQYLLDAINKRKEEYNNKRPGLRAVGSDSGRF
ncbi:hypothetical protein J4443_04230 [Candidatus Woesearchaeota archaeon]|nr:hypothetical protein [Candidatus Woesearchaeota archaeon]